jgi:hypothetical protein
MANLSAGRFAKANINSNQGGLISASFKIFSLSRAKIL